MAAGAGGAGALSLAPLYCAEIAPKARGLAAMPALACRYVFNYVRLKCNIIILFKKIEEMGQMKHIFSPIILPLHLSSIVLTGKTI